MKKLQEVRKEKNLTQWELSLESMIPIGTIQKYESGQADIDGAKLKTLLILCKVLNCNIQDIIEDEQTLELLNLYSLKKK